VRARGGIEVDLAWADGVLTEATVRGSGSVRVRAGDRVHTLDLTGAGVRL
jgi:hypothetical protein